VINGSSGPRINDIFLPEFRTSISAEYSFDSKVDKSITKKKHREFFYKPNEYTKYRIKYNIVITHYTTEEFNALRVLDGKDVRFWPHSDSGLSYLSSISVSRKNLNNKFFINQLVLVIETKRTIAPMSITKTIPAKNSYDVNQTDDIIIMFDKHLSAESCYGNILLTEDETGTVVPITIYVDTNTIRVFHGLLKELCTYSVTIKSKVESVAGDRLRGEYRFSYKTKKYDNLSQLYSIDNAGDRFSLIDDGVLTPIVINNVISSAFGDGENWVSNIPDRFYYASSTPAHNDTNVPISGTVVITLSADILPESVNIESVLFYEDASNKNIPISQFYVIGNKISFPYKELSPNLKHRINLKRTISDSYKERLDIEYIVYFTTAKMLDPELNPFFFPVYGSGTIKAIDTNSVLPFGGGSVGQEYSVNLTNDSVGNAIVSSQTKRMFVTFVSPEPDYDRCEFSQAVTVLFNSEVDSSLINSTNCKITKDGVTVTATISVIGNSIKITPTSALLDNQVYLVSISGVNEIFYGTPCETNISYSFKTKKIDSEYIWFPDLISSDNLSYIDFVKMSKSSVTAGGSGGSALCVDNSNSAIISKTDKEFKLLKVLLAGQLISGAQSSSSFIFFNEEINQSTANIASIKVFASDNSQITITVQATANYILFSMPALFEGAYRIVVSATVAGTNGVQLGSEVVSTFEVFNYLRIFNDIYYAEDGILNFIDVTDFRRSKNTTNNFIYKSLAVGNENELYLNVDVDIEAPTIVKINNMIYMNLNYVQSPTITKVNNTIEMA